MYWHRGSHEWESNIGGRGCRSSRLRSRICLCDVTPAPSAVVYLWSLLCCSTPSPSSAPYSHMLRGGNSLWGMSCTCVCVRVIQDCFHRLFFFHWSLFLRLRTRNSLPFSPPCSKRPFSPAKKTCASCSMPLQHRIAPLHTECNSRNSAANTWSKRDGSYWIILLFS